jgi:CheY-like chemotaxis protein
LKKAAEPEKKEKPAEAKEFSGNRKILLVDDNDINRLVLKEQLKSTGIAVDEAADGIEAVEKFATSAEGEYGLVLMDIQMPRMNGLEATDRIRAMHRGDAKFVPIIAITANAFKEDADEALAHGMTLHLAKPVEYEKLMQVVSLYFKK